MQINMSSEYHSVGILNKARLANSGGEVWHAESHMCMRPRTSGFVGRNKLFFELDMRFSDRDYGLNSATGK